jgi:hypothetical protein
MMLFFASPFSSLVKMPYALSLEAGNALVGGENG